MRFYLDNKGLASLPTVIALGVLILTVGVSIAAMSFSENLAAMRAVQSPRALFYAESGAQDALQKIVRNKNFTATSSYQMEFATNGCTNFDGCAIITVESVNNGRSVTSTGRYKSSIRTVHVDVIWDENSFGEINNQIWQEVTN
jgi:uncharacterized protein (UPF0333 family)